MIPYNGFILSLIMLWPIAPGALIQDQKCQQMRLEIKVQSSTDSGATISLDLPKDIDSRIFLISANSDGVPREVNAVGGQLRNVASGAYDIVIQDLKQKYCTEHRKLTVN